jgi:hypothetical protein
MFDSFPKGQTRISVPVVLIPRPDNEYDPWAVSVAAPKSMGGDKDARHLGFLYRSLIGRLGDKTIPRLAELSDGEIHCTAVIERDEGTDYDSLDPDDPDDLKYAYVDINLDIPRSLELASAIDVFFIANGVDNDDEGKEATARVLERLRTFRSAETALGPLSVAVHEGNSRERQLFATFFGDGSFGMPSSFTVSSGCTPIGCVAVGCLFLDDERHRPTVLDALRSLGIPAAHPQPVRPEAAGTPEWSDGAVPNVHVRWGGGGLTFELADRDGYSGRTTFAHYNTTTRILWVEDQPLVAPACVIAARLGVDVADIRLPARRWDLKHGELSDRSYEWMPNKPKLRPMHPNVTGLVSPPLFVAKELERFAQPGWCKPGDEPTELLEKLTNYRRTLFPHHTYLDVLGTCRICERPAGQFSTPECTEQIAYCHRCLAIAANGLPNLEPTLDRATTRTTLAARALADCEFGGAAFVESQLANINTEPQHPLAAKDIDRRMILRIAIIRRRLPWTHILIAAGLADDGVRLSRGTVLKAVDGHLCLSMQEKAVDDFFHQNGIDHEREPLYPFDEQLNPRTRRRADWRLNDGTLVEMWGMPDDTRYAEKMHEKIELAERHQLRLIGLTFTDIRRLSEIFAEWARR